MLPPTSPPPHLIVFSTLCLFSSSSSLPPLLPSSYLSVHRPPISALVSLVSFCRHHVTQPLSSVVCLNSTIPPSSAIVSLAIFRTQLFSHTCSLCCCSSVIAKVSVPYRHAGVTQVLTTFSLLEISRIVITPQLLSTRSLRPMLSPYSRLHTIPLLDTRNCPPESASGGLCAILPPSLG